MADDWERGSEWRKWELHIHSPTTKLANGYRVESTQDVWADYCRRLHESEVRAFGITDYFSADVYFETVKQYRSRYSDSKKFLFPT
jgi:DNA repair protein SbcC/Rad50